MNIEKLFKYLIAVQSCIEENSDKFNDWESGFLEDIQDTLIVKKALTPRQKEKLFEVLDRYEISLEI